MNRPLRLLVVIPSSFCFGLQHVSLDLLASLKNRVRSHFLVTRWNNGEFINLLNKHEFEFSLSWLGMFSRKLDWYNLKMSIHALSKIPRLYWDALKLIRRQKPDLLLFANHHELILLLPVLRFVKVPIVCHMHDPAPNIPFQRWTFKRYGSRVAHFIAISENVKKRLIALGCPENKVTVVHNGITISRKNQPIEFRVGGQKGNFVVGITGQMTETKGHEDLLKAFRLALSRNCVLRLIIGGKKLEPLYSRLCDEIEKNGLTNFVTFTDWLDDVNEFYSKIDLFVLASRHDEGYGLVVAEAMAHGKPVVITDSGGATEIVEDGKNGFIVPKGSIDNLAHKILTVANDRNLYNEFSKSAVSRVESNFTIEKSSAMFLSALTRIIKNAS